MSLCSSIKSQWTVLSVSYTLFILIRYAVDPGYCICLKLSFIVTNRSEIFLGRTVWQGTMYHSLAAQADSNRSAYNLGTGGA
jgi:hypothetical protein